MLAGQLDTLKTAGELLLDLVAPARCMRCLAEGSWLCFRCERQLVPFGQRCLLCGEERPSGRTCLECSGETNIFGTISFGWYAAPALQRGIHWLKFKGVRTVAPVLARLLVRDFLKIAPLEQLQREAVLVPIPLHRRRLLDRGFNQSEDVAVALGQLLRMPVDNLLARPRATFRQSQLPPDLRAKNMREAFVMAAPLPAGKKIIILIDDVATTGETLSAAAAALRVPDGGQIWAATVARG